MARPRIMHILAVAMGLTLVFGTAAFAADAPVADGDTIDGVFETDADGPNDASQFGDVCPGGSYTRDVRLAARRANNTPGNSFANGTTVTWTFFDATVSDPTPGDGAQEVDPSYGHLAAEYVGTRTMTMPSNWGTQAAGNLWPTGLTANPFIAGRVTLTVPSTSPAGDPNGATSNGTARWRASGTRTAGSPDLTGVDRPMGNNWTVLDGDAPTCDKAATVTAAFATNHVACSATPMLDIRVVDPDYNVTTEDGLAIDVDWGAGISDAQDVHMTGVKAQDGDQTLHVAAPYNAAGSYAATISWSDSHTTGDPTTGSTTAGVAIDFGASGILQPINTDGSSIFKSVSTIPVKLRLTDCDGSTPSNLAPTIRVVRTAGSAPITGAEETPLSTSAHTDGVLRFSEGQWIYNLSGKSLVDPSASYQLIVTVPATGQTIGAAFGLKP